ncbi:MAG: hypothetical protein HYU54_11070, partial [Actinobacteria bacterium]|nr:hypothetical protein [Actinomycetota bacterium]
SPEAQRFLDDINVRLLAAAKDDMDAVGEVFIRGVLGGAAWEGFPDELQRMFTFNAPAIVADFNGGPLDVDLDDLSRIDVNTLLVAASHSPQPFRDVSEKMAAAIPNARTSLVGGGHLVNPAEPFGRDTPDLARRVGSPADRASSRRA